MHKKGITEEVAKKRSRKNVKVQVGLFFGFNWAITRRRRQRDMARCGSGHGDLWLLACNVEEGWWKDKDNGRDDICKDVC